jgi:hypothetical protein
MSLDLMSPLLSLGFESPDDDRAAGEVKVALFLRRQASVAALE